MGDENIRLACLIFALVELRRLLPDPPELLEPSSSSRKRTREEGESGSVYIYRLLRENDDSCQVQLGLGRHMFVQLVNLMVERGLLKDERFIKVPEQVAICLYILAKGASYRDACETFKHSVSTICKYFKLAVQALVSLSFDIIRPQRDLLEVPTEMQNSTKYWPFFKDAIGALDGTLIEAVASNKEDVSFRDRHSSKCWNVLACCSFDRIFTYINVGWEGTTHDVMVQKDSLTNSKFNFPHPPQGKYYLADCEYPDTLNYMSPFTEGGVRVHSVEFRNTPPRGYKEHFNKLHSSLSGKVKCSFDHLKKRWKVLSNMPQTSKNDQMSIIIATFTLHNFIRMHLLGIPVKHHDRNVQGVADFDMYDDARQKSMVEVREAIGREIWAANRSESDNEDDIVVAHGS